VFRVRHVDDDQHVVGKFRQMDRDIGIAAADIPDAVRPEAAERQEGDFARRFRPRQIVDAKPAGEFLARQGAGRSSREIGLLAHLHSPHARPVDRQHEAVVGLQMMGARIRRAGQEIDRFWLLRIAHVDNGNAVGKTVADIGKAALDHDLHAIAAAALVGMAEKLDVMAGDGGH